MTMRPVLHIKRLSALFVSVIFVASFLVTVVSPIVAAKNYTQMNPTEQAKSWVYLKIFKQCWTGKGLVTIDDNDVKSGNWFRADKNNSNAQIEAPAWFVRSLGENGGSSYVTNDSGWGSSLNDTRVFYCSRDNKSSWLKPLAELWGFTDNTSIGGSGLVDMFCELGGRRANNKNSNLTDCKRGTGVFTLDNITKDPIAVILKKIGNAGSSLTPAAEYIYWRGIFQKGCGASATDVNYDNGDSKNLFIKNVKTVADDGTVSSRNYLMSPVSGGPGNKTDKTRVYSSTGSEVDMSCESIAKAMSNKADAFGEWVKNSTCEKKYSGNEVSIEACKQGRSANTTEDCEALFSNDTAKRDACIEGMGLSDGTANSSSAEDSDAAVSEDKATCSTDIGALGWILCPVVNFLGKATDGLYGIINNFLHIESHLFDNGNATQVWGMFRNVANILLVAAFLLIIYSQMTGVGISNYGVKRLLPKIIMVAILINASLFISRLLIDISNLLGGSLYGFLNNMQGGSGEINATQTVASVLAGGAATAAVGYVAAPVVSSLFGAAAIWIVGFIVLGAVLGLIVSFLILMVRNAVVIILAVIAPVAFVMLLLPNTEKYFQKWWKIFFSLLLVYPMIAVLFGLSKIAASIFTSGDASDGLMAIAVSCLPLLASTALMQASMAATGTLGAKLQGFGRMSKSLTAGMAKQRFGETGLSKALNVRSQQRRRESNARFASTDFSTRGGRAIRLVAGPGSESLIEQSGSSLVRSDMEERKDQAKALLDNERLYSFNRVAEGVKNGVITDRAGNSRRLTDLEYVAATELMIEKGNPEQRRAAFAQAMARSQKMEDSDKVYLQRQATNSMFSKGETAVFGASAIGNLDGVGSTATLEVEGQKYTFDMTTEEGVTNYLGVAAAGRIKAKETKPAVMLGDSKTAAVMQKVLSGDFQDINGASVKFSDKEKNAIRSQLEAFAATEDGSGDVAEASLDILGVRSAAKQQADAAAEHKKQQQDFIDALRNRKN